MIPARTLTRCVAGIATTATLWAVTAAPAEAASETRRIRHIAVGPRHWWATHWEATTTARSVHGAQDSARLCATVLPKDANFRIYAYDSRGRLLASTSQNDARFGCRTLTAPKRTARFLFRLNVIADGRGEKAWTMAATR
jgi:photosystem II stability/assembly factor-like uncharacterized protein